MRRFRPPVDPHLDPLRAPSAQGQHPHVHRLEDEVKNPQDMYEQRDAGANYRPFPRAAAHPRPVGQVPPATPGLLDNPLVVFGLGALAVYAIAKLAENDEDRPRRNPEPAPAPQAPSVVVVSPPNIPVQTATTALPASPALPPPAVQSVTVEASERVTEKASTPKPPKKRTISPERRAQMKKDAAKQGRYTSGPKKGQFKPKGKK